MITDLEENISTTQEPIKRGPGRPKGYSPKADTAPKGTKVRAAAPKGATWANAKSVEATLTQTLEGIGLGVKLLNSFDGETIIAGAPKLSSALVDLATNDPRYRKFLESASAPGKYGPLLIAVGGIALPIAMNHGLFDVKPKVVKDAPVDPLFDSSPVMEENIESMDIPAPNYSGDSDNLGLHDSVDSAEFLTSLGVTHEE